MDKIVAEICKLFGNVVSDPDKAVRLALLMCLLLIGLVIVKLAA